VVFTSYEGNVLVFTATSNASRLLRRVGLPALRDLGRPEPGGQVSTLSVERLADLDADVVLGLDFDGEGGALDAIEAEPLFDRLEAVREGNYHRLGHSESTAINHPSVLSVPVALDALRRVLTP
jgi:ABC-type Fe3+-hydroxamate transport system substrate-binding protein